MTADQPEAPRAHHVVLEADGGARGNPGPAGYGALLRDASTGATMVERYAGIGVATNNVAEYSGLIAGLSAAVELGVTHVEVRMDSKLVVEQMAGRWRIKHPALRALAAEASALVAQFDEVRFTWIPRERNRAADALANRAIDAGDSSRSDSTRSDSSRSDSTRSDSSLRGSAQVAGPEDLDVAPAPTPDTLPGVPSTRAWTAPAALTALRLVLVRHGATPLTAERRYSGRGEAHLSGQGHAQALAVARRVPSLVTTPLVAVVASPLTRCQQTAEPIAQALDHPGSATVEPDLVECDFGDWEGLTFADVSQRYSVEHAAWLSSTDVAPPGGESFAQVGHRVSRWRRRLLQRYPSGTVVAVTHVSPIKLLLRDALAASDDFLFRCYLSPTGISVVDYYPDGGVAVRMVNETAHLDGDC